MDNPFQRIMGAFAAYKNNPNSPRGMPWQGRSMSELSPQERINQAFGVPMQGPSMSPQDRINGGFGAMFSGQGMQAGPPPAPPPAPPPPQLGMTPMPPPRPPEAPQGQPMAPPEPMNPLQQLAAYFRANSAPSTATGPARSSEPVY